MQKQSAISPLLCAYLFLGCTFLCGCSKEPASILTPHHPANNDPLAPSLRPAKCKRTYVGRSSKKYYKRGSSKRLSQRLPDAKDFFGVTPQCTLSNTEAKPIIQEALQILSSNDVPYALNRGIKKLKNAVKQYGSSEAMYQLGVICEQQEDMLQAVKWYGLSFQNEWFKNLPKLAQFPAYVALQRIAQDDQDVKRLLLLYPLKSAATLVEKKERCIVLMQFYKHGTAEPYLTPKENRAKIARLQVEQQRIVDQIQGGEQKLKNIQRDVENIIAKNTIVMKELASRKELANTNCSENSQGSSSHENDIQRQIYIDILNGEAHLQLLEKELSLREELRKTLQAKEKLIFQEVEANKDAIHQYEQLIKGIKCLKNQTYAEALKCLLKAGTLPDTLYHLGWIYSHVDSYLDYKKAAACFAKSITHYAFYELGLLYQKRLAPGVSETVAYQLSIDYLTLAGTPEALCKLGMIFYEQDDYLQAQAYFERAGTSEAYLYLGYLYEKGYIGANVPQPDYQQAIIHYKQVTGEERDNKLMQKILELEILQIDIAIKERAALETAADISIPITTKQPTEEYNPDLATNLVKLSTRRNLAKERIQLLEEKQQQKALWRAKRRRINIDHTPYVIPQRSIQFTFVENKDKEDFEIFLQDPKNKKVKAIMEDIQQAQWATVGIGKPEVLSYPFRGYEGCISRRINGANRFVYKVMHHEGDIHILILGWEGHYENQ